MTTEFRWKFAFNLEQMVATLFKFTPAIPSRDHVKSLMFKYRPSQPDEDGHPLAKAIEASVVNISYRLLGINCKFYGKPQSHIELTTPAG
jgi:hypothetical protein